MGSLYNNAIFVSTFDKMPKDPHFAIIKYSTVSTPSYDEGGPDGSQSIVEYQAYMDENDWKAAITELMVPKYGSVCKFTAIRVNPATIIPEFKVTIK
jgi:hypothetical protein